jgi:hypothetical protein
MAVKRKPAAKKEPAKKIVAANPKPFFAVHLSQTGTARNPKRITLKTNWATKSFAFDKRYKDSVDMAAALLKANKINVAGYAEHGFNKFKYIIFTKTFPPLENFKNL